MEMSFGSWFRLAKDWLSGDRIRIAPSEGQWLSIPIGNRVLIRQQVWVVSNRQICDAIDECLPDNTASLLYTLTSDDAEVTGLLRVTIPLEASVRLANNAVLIIGQERYELFPEDVVVMSDRVLMRNRHERTNENRG
ncbi:MAG: hypothetical protein WCK15_14810 [Pirellula sp.]